MVEFLQIPTDGVCNVMRIFALITVLICSAAGAVAAGGGFSIFDAINQAVKSNPGVGEASASRRAIEAEYHQSQGVLLPQVRLDLRAGPEKFNELDITPPPQGNGSWLPGRSAQVVVRQMLFDGFASLNEIWRQAARVDAAAYRVHERTELIALDAAEAYIDVARYIRLITIAGDNVTAHRQILANVEARFSGGRAGEGDLQQARERVYGAEAALVEFRQSLEDAKASYRRTIGLEPINVRAPGRLRGMPATKDQSLAVALQYNPTIRAAKADADAAKAGFHATAGAFMPNVSLEGRGMVGNDTDLIYGRQNQLSGKVVMSWDLFTGGQDSWKRAAAGEHYIETTMAHARLERAAFESLDKAWSGRTITSDRIAALGRQISSDRKAISAYEKEYEIGQRSLIDLLNARNQLYIALVSLESTRSVAVFADYQLLAAMGQLLTYLKSPSTVEALPLESVSMFPNKFPPILTRLPDSGPEPVKMADEPGAPPPDATAPLFRYLPIPTWLSQVSPPAVGSAGIQPNDSAMSWRQPDAPR
jgi:outer membrane protein, adhesin transport system